jgi:hypothetical protein
METILRQQESPDVSTEQRRSSELVKRIRKLRWMGLEGEARGMQVQLASYGGTRADSVLATPRETD